MSSLLSANALCKVYYEGGRELRVVRDVTVNVFPGEVLAIMGPSGAGKSTLLHILGALDRPTSGDVTYDGVAFGSLSGSRLAELRNRQFGFVFQFFHLLPDLSALENVMLPAMMGTSTLGWLGCRAGVRQRAMQLLEHFGLGDRARHKPAKLSGGERQRVAIARALVNRPRLVFCDEPTGNLDSATSNSVIDMIVRLNHEEHQAFVIVTHNEQLALRAGRVLHIIDGQIVDSPPQEGPSS